jgi:hypothetical protein
MVIVSAVEQLTLKALMAEKAMVAVRDTRFMTNLSKVFRAPAAGVRLGRSLPMT